MNQFGGDWTKIKIEILVEYAKAYLNIMNVYAKRYNWKLLYFDGFAGSGRYLSKNDDKFKQVISMSFIKGAAIRILEINDPKPFDIYYFVEKDEKNKTELEEATKLRIP